MSVIRNKQRLIHLYRYLLDCTDEEHQATTNDLVEFLRQEDANASRKTVKDDIEILIEEGVDIVVTKSFFNSYFVGSRQFEIPEIELLVDGIIPNKTLSKGKKEAIIEKLLSLISVYQAEKIRKKMHCGCDSGSKCEKLYYNIDRISDAINDNKKISFLYCGSSAAVQGNGAVEQKLVVTPVEIRSKHDRYYLLAYCGEKKELAVFLLNHVYRIKTLAEMGDPLPSYEEIIRFLRSLFAMEPGKLTEVTIEYSSALSEMIKERFGEKSVIWRSQKDGFYAKVPVSVSPSFYGWVFRYSPDIRIVGPAWVREEYMKKAEEALRL